MHHFSIKCIETLQECTTFQSTILKHYRNAPLFRDSFGTRLQAPEDGDRTCLRNVVYYKVIQNEKLVYWKMITWVTGGGNRKEHESNCEWLPLIVNGYR